MSDIFNFLLDLETDEHMVYLIGGALLFVFVIYLEGIRVRAVERESNLSETGANRKSNNLDTSLCQSEDCVRCTKNTEILRKALTRLSFYSENGVTHSPSSSTATEINAVTTDIKLSIKSLKLREQELLRGVTLTDDENDGITTSNPLVLKLSGLREEKIWTIEDFPAVNILKKNLKHIKLEFSHLYRSPLSETTCLWKTNQTSQGKWEIALLVNQGQLTKAAELCPITMSLIGQVPYLMRENLFGNVSFSVIHPGSEIVPHFGSTNCRIRCHLGLTVPQNPDECTLTVGEEMLHWKDGETIFFNDAYLHTVKHAGDDSSGIRAVLMLDLWHPDITEAQRTILDYAFPG